jgi:hypothetical protein
MTTMTRAQARAVDEAAGVVASLADLIADLDEQLTEARTRLGELEGRWDALGEEMAQDHEIGSSPYTSREDAQKAVKRFHEVKAKREQLDEPRREVAAEVIGLQRRLLFLKSGRIEWQRRADQLEAGTDPDGNGGSTGAPGRAGGEGTVEAPAESDVSPEPADLQRASSAASTGSAGAPALPERPRSRWWSR